MSKEVAFRFDALSHSLEYQANAYGFTLGKDAEYLERLNIAVLDCYISGLSTEYQRNAMTKKLIKKAMKALKPIKTEDD